MKCLAIPLMAALAFSSAGVAQQVALVDVQKCLREYKKASEFQDQLKAELEAKRRSLIEEKNKIRAQQENLDLHPPGSDSYLDALKKIKLDEVNAELEEKTIVIQMEKRLADYLVKLYNDIKREIKAIAEEKGYKVVLMYVAAPLEGRREQDVTNNILVRPVLYFDPNADITAEVISRLNK